MTILELPNENIIRSQELQRYSLLDTMPEEEYDSITKFIAEVCNTPICIIALLDHDRQFFKSTYGFDAPTPSLHHSFCNHTIKNVPEIFIVNDSRKDERFKENPLIYGENGIVFYAGVPLVSKNGIAIGTICVVDHKPGNLDAFQQKFLYRAATNIMKLFELRRTNLELKNANMELGYRNLEMERFAYTAAHDIKSPLNHIIQLNKLIETELSSEDHTHVRQLVSKVANSANKLRSLIDGILNHSKSDAHPDKAESFDFTALTESVFSLFATAEEYELVAPKEQILIETNKLALEQILINLVSNAIKHNDKSYVYVEVKIQISDTSYKIMVTDNGPGIPKTHYEHIFKIFEKLNEKDRFGNDTTGIGLATVNKLAASIGATITVDSILKCGTTFVVEIPR